MIEVQVKNLDELKRDFKNLTPQFDKALEKGMYKGGLKVQKDTKIAISQEKKSGNEYYKKSSKNGSPYRVYVKSGQPIPTNAKISTASAEGEAPASDTGFLVNNIMVNRSEQVVTITSHADYSEKLIRELNRPFLEPQLEENENYINNEVEAELNKVIQKANGNI